MNNIVRLPISCLGSCYSGTSSEEILLAIGSLFSDTYIPSEVLLIVDGVVDDKLNLSINYLVKKFSIKVIRLEYNIGLGLALNKGIKECNFDLVFRYDTDDISLPQRLKTQYDFLIKNPEVDVLGSFVREFKKNNGKYYSRLKKVPSNFREIKKSIYFRNPLNHPSVAFRKSIIIKVGNYQDIKFFEDYYLWLKLFKLGYKIENLDEVFVYMKRNYASMRRSGIEYLKYELNFLRIIRSNSLMSFLFFIFNLLRLPIRVYPLFYLLEFVPWRSKWKLDASIFQLIEEI